MSFIRKIFAAAAGICLMVTGLAGCASEEGEIIPNWFSSKETIYFWYPDESMTEYINAAAVSFGADRNVRVIPTLVSDSAYLEAIYEATLHSDKMPDAYILSHDQLEKAYLSGLAEEVRDGGGILTEKFSDAALNAVTYKGKKIAWPFYFDTTALICNRTYLQEWVSQQMNAASEDPGEMEEEEEAVLDETRKERLLSDPSPLSLEDILFISNTFDVPEGVEGVLKWDVSDIFYNYWVTGNYMNTGGETGDSVREIDLNNENAAQCLAVYQGLNQFFSIESDSVSYETVLEEFLSGKFVFTVATADAVEKITKAREDGSFTYECTVLPMPDVSDALESRSMSVTGTVVVNGYSAHKELAEEFAAYLVSEYDADLYERCWKLPACLDRKPQGEFFDAYYEEYAQSIPLPKMMKISNFWVELEALFSRVWNGGNIEKELSLLAENIGRQLE